MSDAVTVVTLVLATHWLTYFVTRSEFPLVGKLHSWVYNFEDSHPRSRAAKAVAYLITCPWCASPYIAGTLVLLSMWLVGGGVPAPALVALAAASYSGSLQMVVDRYMLETKLLKGEAP